VERAQQAINEIKESTGNSNIEFEKFKDNKYNIFIFNLFNLK